MALISCPECKKVVSDKAKACPFCGCPGEYFPKASDTEPDNAVQGKVNSANNAERKNEANLEALNIADDFTELFEEGALKTFDFTDKSVRNLCLLLDQLIDVCKKNDLKEMPKAHKKYEAVSRYVRQMQYDGDWFEKPYLFSHFSQRMSLDEFISNIWFYNKFLHFFNNYYLKGNSTDWFKEDLFDSNGYLRAPSHPIYKVTRDPEGDLLLYIDTSMSEMGRKGIALTKEYVVDLSTLNKFPYSAIQVNISMDGKSGKLFISTDKTTGMVLPMSEKVNWIELNLIGNLIKDLKNRVASSKPSEYIKQKTGLDRSLDLMYLNRNKKEETKKEITIDFDIDNCGADKRSIRMAKALVKYANDDNYSDFIKVEKWKAIKTKYPNIRETGEEVFGMMYLNKSEYNPAFATNIGIKTKNSIIPFCKFKRIVIDEYHHPWLYYSDEFDDVSCLLVESYSATIVLKALLESLNISDIDIITQNGKEYCAHCGSVSFRRKFFSQICLECGADTCLGELKTRYDDYIDQEIKHAKESFDKMFEEL